MDYEATRRVQQLLTSLTDAKSSSLDAEKLSELKGLLKHSEGAQLVEYTTPLLLDRLACESAQARKLCVELCAVLFSRSRAFRQLLTQQFTTFVELAVGHRAESPLPGPPAAAQALRARALEVIEEWQEAWGAHYPQVTAAYRYLTKQYKFPQVASRAAAAAAEAAARLARHQELLLQRYAAFRADFPQQRAELDSLIQQLQQCMELLQQQPAPPAPPATAAATPAAAEGVPGEGAQHEQSEVGEQAAPGTAEEQEWEDVATAAAAGGGDSGGAGDGGDELCGFDVEELLGDTGTSGAQAAAAAAAELAVRNASLLEHLTDLSRQAALAARKPLLDWLRLLTQVQPPEQRPQRVAQQQGQQRPPGVGRQQGAGSQGLQQQQQGAGMSQEQQQWQQERQGLLREVVRLRAQLQALTEEAANTWGVSSGTRSNRQQQEPPPALPSADAAALHSAHPGAAPGQPEAVTAAGVTPELTSLPSRAGGTGQHQQHQQPASGAQAAPHLTLGSSLRRLQQHQQQAAAATGASRGPLPAAAAVHNAYAHLRDPTVAVGAYTISQEVIARNEQLKSFSTPPAAAAAAAAAAASASGVSPAEPGAGSSSSAAAAAGGGNITQRSRTQGSAGPGHRNLTSQPGAAGPDGSSSSSGSRKRPAGGGAAPEVLRKLAASAPQLPISGEDWLLAEWGVSQHGMELYNHWGAVDASVGVPKDRLGQLMGYAASYYTPSQQQQPAKRPATEEAAAAAAGTRLAVAADGGGQPSQQTTPAHGLPAQRGSPSSAGAEQAPERVPAANSGAAAAAAAAAAGGDGRPPQPPPQQQQQDSAVALSGGVDAAGGAAPQPPGQQRQRPMSRREAASAHNRSVLAGAFSDERIAAALQQQLDEEAAAAAAGAAGSGGKKGRVKKPPERKGDKIRKQLLK